MHSTTMALDIHIFTCGRTVGAQSRQLSCLWFVSPSPLRFGLLMVRQARQAKHLTHATDNHDMHQAARGPNHSTFIYYHTSLQTQHFVVTLSVGAHQNTTFWGPIILNTVHLTLQATPPPVTAHAQVSSRKNSDVRRSAQHEYR